MSPAYSPAYLCNYHSHASDCAKLLAMSIGLSMDKIQASIPAYRTSKAQLWTCKTPSRFPSGRQSPARFYISLNTATLLRGICTQLPFMPADIRPMAPVF